MRLSLASVILSAGVAISQASAAPLGVVWVNEIKASTTSSPIALGHAAAQPAGSFVATIHVATSMTQAPKPWTKPRVACVGSLRNMKEWLKHAFPHTKPAMHGDAGRVAQPLGHIKETVVRPAVHKHPYEHRPQFFGQRISRALQILDPWEAGILGFLSSCGLCALIVIFWVFYLLFIRSARGPRRQEEFLAYEVILEGQEPLLPPQTSESNTPAEEGKEKN